MPKTPHEVTSKFFEPAPERERTTTENNEEALVKIGDAVFNTEHIFAKSDFNDNLVKAMAKGMLYAKRYNCSIMKDLCEQIAINRLSLGRGSRKEFERIAQSANPPEQTISIPSIRQRLLGE